MGIVAMIEPRKYLPYRKSATTLLLSAIAKILLFQGYAYSGDIYADPRIVEIEALVNRADFQSALDRAVRAQASDIPDSQIDQKRILNLKIVGILNLLCRYDDANDHFLENKYTFRIDKDHKYEDLSHSEIRNWIIVFYRWKSDLIEEIPDEFIKKALVLSYNATWSDLFDIGITALLVKDHKQASIAFEAAKNISISEIEKFRSSIGLSVVLSRMGFNEEALSEIESAVFNMPDNLEP